MEKTTNQGGDEFVSLVAHQLGTPLGIMRWLTQSLLHGDAGSLTESQRESLEEILDTNNRMYRLVKALLNISRVESGRLQINPELTDLRTFVDMVVKEIYVVSKTKQQTVSVMIDPALDKVTFDPELMYHVYFNLLNNAIKYTPPHGKITITITKEGETFLTDIADTGVGIPSEDMGKIFTKFFRAANVLERDTEGSGLGLYLVKTLLEASGGTITVESIKDKGTTFHFRLPLTGTSKKEGSVNLAHP